MRLILIFIFILNSIAFYSQNFVVSVKDKHNNPLPGATVKLLCVKDSTERYVSSDLKGLASFSNIFEGLYKISVSYVGFNNEEKTFNIKNDNRFVEFRLEESSTTLDEVTIQAKRPLITQEGDKLIIDPENLEGVSSNAVEVLESTPGLYVDQDGGVFLNSATPAKIYINGRELKMSTQDINVILQSLPPSSIQKIEVLRTPSSKYDASSSGGIINIILKKGVKIGRFGSVNADFNKAKYQGGNLGLSLNYNGDKYSVYVNANYRYSDQNEILKAERLLKDNNILIQESETRRKTHNCYAGYGLNYDFNEKLSLSYDGRINYSFPKTYTISIGNTKDIDNVLIAENENTIENSSEFFNLQQDLSVVKKLDTIESKWETKFSYNFSNRSMNQIYSYNFHLPSEYLLAGNGKNNFSRQLYSFQSDINKNLPYRIVFETGIKSSYQFFSNNADFYVNFGSGSILDPIRTNHYNYNELISAIYLQVSKTIFKDFVIKSGIRLEHTFMEGSQNIPVDTGFVVNRTDLFPYVYLSHTIFKMREFELKAYAIYRKSINRPEYDMLNPNITIVDQYLYQTGNPTLKPQFTDNIEVNISYEDFPVFALGRNFTKDIFSGVVYSDLNNPQIAVQTYDNLGKSKETYFRGMAGIPPGGVYFFGAGAQYNLNEFNGFYQGEQLSYKRGSWRIYTFHMIKPAKNTRITLMGFMMINGQFDFYELQNFGMLNIGIKQNFLNGRLSLSLKFRDILRTMNVKYELNKASVNVWGERYTDNRSISINLRYNFGFGNKHDEKKNNFKLDEEM